MLDSMGSTFNPQILVEKLAKLNNTQQSIETLSHWCIFHMNKAKQVVETWSRQFHCSPREQRLAYLYLANDILQNSRRKGSEFVAEFWKVLPDALRDVIKNGDEFGKSSARRLINIWDDRKVFGSRGHILKEEFVGRQAGSNNRNGNPTGLKLRPAAGNVLDKVVSGYHSVYSDNVDEDALLDRCRSTISSIEKADKEFGGDLRSGHVSEPGILDELKGNHSVLRDCIQHLSAVASSRANLVTLLREALQEQEFKLDQVHHQLQAAQSHSELVGDILSDQGQKEITISSAPQGFTSNGEQSAPVMFASQVSSAETSGTVEGDNKSAAAVVAAKLAASTSSAEMLSFVLSSLASDGVIGNALNQSLSDYPAEKRAKTENDNSLYIHMQNPQPAAPSFPQPERSQNNSPATSQRAGGINEKPPLPSSPPPMAPLPPMQPYALPPYIQAAGAVPVGLYSYGTMQQPPAPIPGYLPQLEPPMSGVAPFSVPQPNAFQKYPTEGGFYGQPSSMPMAPINNHQ